MAKNHDKEIDEINALYEQKKSNHIKELGSKKALANVVVCGLFFLGAVIYMLVFEHPTVSEIEKRTLAKFPEFSWDSYFKGEYTAQISEFYDDTVPNRDFFKRLNSQIQKLFGITTDAGTFHGNLKPVESGGDVTAITTAEQEPIVIVTPAPSTEDDPVSSDNSQTDASEVPPETSEPESTVNTVPDETTPPPDSFQRPEGADAEILYNEADQMVYRSGDQLYGISLYKGQEGYGDSLAQSINKFADSLPDSNVYAMIAPTQNTFVLPQSLVSNINDELTHIENLNKKFADNVSVVDAYSALEKHSDEALYFKRDIHWTQLAAYYAAEAFAKKADIPFLDLSQYDKDERDCMGSAYTNTKYSQLEGATETFTYYKPKNDISTEYYDSNYEHVFDYLLMPEVDYIESAFYCLFMVSPDYIKKITTDVENDKVLVVFKDSYPSAMIPFLTSSYEKIYVIDVRSCDFNGVDFCNEVGATDVFFGLNAFSAFGSIGENIETIRTQ